MTRTSTRGTSLAIRSGPSQALWECGVEGCRDGEDLNSQGMKNARRHHRKTGHTVHVIRETAFTYRGKEE
jgi:hypothetical protein